MKYQPELWVLFQWIAAFSITLYMVMSATLSDWMVSDLKSVT
ncbi:MAG: hypothetical protein OSA51_08430 [Octadecabacter sp.]|nr:hypothetical protein [Octadecabacter sp.]